MERRDVKKEGLNEEELSTSCTSDLLFIMQYNTINSILETIYKYIESITHIYIKNK